MSRSVQIALAALLTTAAGFIVLGAAGFLTVDAIAAQRALPSYNALVAELRQKLQTDAKTATVLQAEYDRQTIDTLQREARNRVLTRALAGAAIVFLLSAKRWVALRNPRIAPPPQVVALFMASSARANPEDAVSSVERNANAHCHLRPGQSPAATAAAPAATVEDVDLRIVERIVAREGRGAEAVIPILHALQNHYHYLPDAALRRVNELTDIAPAQLTGVATFYAQFRRTPQGEHLVTVCHGTACHVAGAARISEELRRRLHIAPGQDTDARRQFTVQEVPCLGCCTLAPVVQMDGETHGHVQADGVGDLVEECCARKLAGTKARRHVGARVPVVSAHTRAEIRIGLGSCCVANGSERVYAALHEVIESGDMDVDVKRVGCVGMCHQTPFVEVRPAHRAATLYTRVQPEQARAIVRRHFKSSSFAGRLRDAAAKTARRLRSGSAARAAEGNIVEWRDPKLAAFLGPQKHIATEHCGELDPLDLDEYLVHDGFQALERCRKEPLSPEQIIDIIQRSGLRGRGGAGYPTWKKWSQVRQATSQTKYIICNGDEGDPGAFMDRMLMESYPYRVIEGIAIAARATGATEAICYIRAEYPLAVERITQAVRRCEERGMLGGHPHGTGGPAAGSSAVPSAGHWPALQVRVVQGAGAFVCGEETALIASLEGRRGMPALRPPYPADEGLWNQPTLINNVETFAVVPWIIRNGPEPFAAVGTPASKGTKVFALTGKIRRGGLIEVPMGITIRAIVEDIGGGIRDELTAAGPQRRTFKAVQIGGPSGGCVPAALADTPVDYEALSAVGAIMGSGGLVVLDETDCMVDIARYFLSFTQNQSCGKCTPCRVGTKRMLEILEQLCSGQGQSADLAQLEELARAVGTSSLCGLGKTAPNPVLTTLRYFREEYEAHLAGRCPAGKCRTLVRYVVTEKCTGCTLCAQHCPAGAIALRPYERHEIDDEKCTRCDGCRIRCPENAIEIGVRA